MRYYQRETNARRIRNNIAANIGRYRADRQRPVLPILPPQPQNDDDGDEDEIEMENVIPIAEVLRLPYIQHEHVNQQQQQQQQIERPQQQQPQPPPQPQRNPLLELTEQIWESEHKLFYESIV